MTKKFDKEQSAKTGTKTLNEKKVRRVLYNSSTEGVLVVNEEGFIRTVNPGVEGIFGYSKDELIDKNIQFVIPNLSSDSDCFKNDVSKFSSTLKDYYGVRKDGVSIPIHFSCNHFEADGQMLVMILVNDLTDVKKKESHLLDINAELEQRVEESTKAAFKSEHLFRMIARNFPNGLICVLDRDFNFVYMDGMELHNSALGEKLIQGDNFLMRIDQDKQYDIKKRLLKAFQGNQSTFELKIDDQTYMINAVGLEVAEYEMERILVVTQNITYFKKAEKDILKSLHKEKELSEVKSRFVSMASHEFRTPLTTIMNSTMILSKLISGMNNDPRALKQIQRIKSTINQLTTILEDILSLQKLEEGKLDVHYSEISVPDFTEDVIEEMKDMTKPGQVIQYYHQGTNFAFVDFNMLKNIYNNLISNAIKYSPEEENIIVRTFVESNLLKIEVEDRGIGIPEEEQTNIFGRFFRANNATNIKGTGLGLNIVKKYMEMVKGKIHFNSRVGEGTTFYVELPLEIASVEISSVNTEVR